MTANYVLLEKITVGAAGASSVTFSGIPQTGYTDLVVKGSARTNRSDAQNDFFKILPNGSSSSWTARFVQGTGSSAASYTQSVAANIVGEVNGATSTANTFGSFEIYCPNYTSTSTYKSFSSDSAMENNATLGVQNLLAGLWSDNSAITSLTFAPGVGTAWLANSTFYLYGVAKLGTTPAILPYANGGDIIDTDGTYWYHTFLSSGTFTPQKSLSVDYLVVAGGGGGGGRAGGGGGAGGYRTSIGGSALSLGTSAYTVTIGAGGVGGDNSSPSFGTSGSNSVFASITSTGGGGGGGLGQTSGSTGGSGGGGSGRGVNGTGGAGTSGQGFAGATGVGTTPGGYGGGGGGANAAATGQAGAAGIASSISGTSVTRAGGGGGGGWGSGGASGGSGGGGAGGGDGVAGTAGTVNTGGGGGAGGDYNTGAAGAAGGSGIVIVRYAV